MYILIDGTLYSKNNPIISIKFSPPVFPCFPALPFDLHLYHDRTFSMFAFIFTVFLSLCFRYIAIITSVLKVHESCYFPFDTFLFFWKLKNITCSRIERMNIFKTTTLLMTLQIFHAILIKIQRTFFKNLVKSTIQFV